MKHYSLTLFFLISFIGAAFAQANVFPASGNVGIGTTAPTDNLQVVASVSGSVGVSGSTGNVKDFKFETAGVQRWILRSDGTAESGANAGSDFNILGRDDSGTLLGSYLFVKRSNGNTGIGTITPTSKLSIQLGSNEDRQLDISLIGSSLPTGQRHAYLGITNGGGTAPFNTVGDLYVAPRTTISAAIRFITYDGTSVGERMILDGTGNLGIGTSNTYGNKLAVNGAVLATAVTVKLNANWPDYVFKPSYHLPLLSDVKTYIDQNNRLPEMPSEAQVAKEGVNLGEMNKLLVKKVEELTLYLIEQNKRIGAQQAQIDQLIKAGK